MKNEIEGLPIVMNMALAERLSMALVNYFKFIESDIVTEVQKVFSSYEVVKFFAEDESLISKVKKKLTKGIKSVKEKYKPYFENWKMDTLKNVIINAKKACGNSIRKIHKNFVRVKTVGKDGIEYLKAVAAEIDLYLEGIFPEMTSRVMSVVYKALGARNAGALTKLVDNIKNQFTIKRKRIRSFSLNLLSRSFSRLSSIIIKKTGINHFKWVYSYLSKEPRIFHKHVLNGGVFEVENPPVIDPETGERGYPAQLINCKCLMVPVMKFKQ